MIAALFVERGGVYWDLPDVDPWDQERDARLYAGPWPVVAHPPCERWGRYWHGGPSAKVRKVKGDDGGCFESALASIRRWGGVLEHPQASAAWKRFGLLAPMYGGGVVLGWLRGRMDVLRRAGQLRSPGTESDMALCLRGGVAAVAALGAVGGHRAA